MQEQGKQQVIKILYGQQASLDTFSNVTTEMILQEYTDAMQKQKTAAFIAKTFQDCTEDPLTKVQHQLGKELDVNSIRMLNKALNTFRPCMSDAGFATNNL